MNQEPPINFDDFQNFDNEPSNENNADELQSNDFENLALGNEIQETSNHQELFSHEDEMNKILDFPNTQELNQKYDNENVASKSQQIICYIHNEECGLFFCHDCNSFKICLQCVVKGMHSSHNITKMEQFFPLIEEKFNDFIVFLEKKSNILQSSVANINLQHRNLGNEYGNIKSFISCKIIELRKEIDQFEREIFEFLDNNKKKEIEILNKHLLNIQKLQRDLEIERKKASDRTMVGILELFSSGELDKLDDSIPLEIEHKPNIYNSTYFSLIFKDLQEALLNKRENIGKTFNNEDKLKKRPDSVRDSKEKKEKSSDKLVMNLHSTHKNLLSNEVVKFSSGKGYKYINYPREDNNLPQKEEKKSVFYSKILEEKSRNLLKHQENVFSKNTFLSPSQRLTKNDYNSSSTFLKPLMKMSFSKSKPKLYST